MCGVGGRAERARRCVLPTLAMRERCRRPWPRKRSILCVAVVLRCVMRLARVGCDGAATEKATGRAGQAKWRA